MKRQKIFIIFKSHSLQYKKNFKIFCIYLNKKSVLNELHILGSH